MHQSGNILRVCLFLDVRTFFRHAIVLSTKPYDRLSHMCRSCSHGLPWVTYFLSCSHTCYHGLPISCQIFLFLLLTEQRGMVMFPRRITLSFDRIISGSTEYTRIDFNSRRNGIKNTTMGSPWPKPLSLPSQTAWTKWFQL